MRKNIKLTSLAAMAITLGIFTLSGCGASSGEADATTAAVSSDTSAETTSEAETSETTVSETSAAPEATETSEETTAETETTETASETAVLVSAENTVFVDFTDIKNYEGSMDIGDIADQAVEYVRCSDDYKETLPFSSQLPSLLDDCISEYSDSGKEVAEEYCHNYFSEDGTLTPVLHKAYPNDYDGDGNTEYFLVVTLPQICTEISEDFCTVMSHIIFCDSYGNMTEIDCTANLYEAELFDYGKYKQIVLGGAGSMGADDHITLWGVKDGDPVDLSSIRGKFIKEKCVLGEFDFQYAGGTMYFDMDAFEYRYIAADNVDYETAAAMDSTGVLGDFDKENVDISFLGNKYYIIRDSEFDYGKIYEYVDGAFSLVYDNSDWDWDSLHGIRGCLGVANTVNVDLNSAFSEMINPEEAAAR